MLALGSPETVDNNSDTSCACMIDLHTTDGRSQTRNMKRMSQSTKWFRINCIHVISAIVIVDLILTVGFFSLYMFNVYQGHDHSPKGNIDCRLCENDTFSEIPPDNSHVSHDKHVTVKMKTLDHTPCCKVNVKQRSTDANINDRYGLDFSTTGQPWLSTISIQVGLKHPLTNGRLEWSFVAGDLTNHKTDTINLSTNNVYVTVPQRAMYRITDNLTFETVNKQFTLTHYINYRNAQSKTHSVLAKTIQTVGSSSPSNAKRHTFTQSSLSGTYILEKGSMVSVYVSKQSIPYLVKDIAANYFGIELVAPL